MAVDFAEETHMSTPVNGSASAHWLEHLSENLESLLADVRRTAYSLLYLPWKCSRDDVSQCSSCIEARLCGNEARRAALCVGARRVSTSDRVAYGAPVARHCSTWTARATQYHG